MLRKSLSFAFIDFSGYIRYIEKELGRLKNENKKLQEMNSSCTRKPPANPTKKPKPDPQVSHALKTAIGKCFK